MLPEQLLDWYDRHHRQMPWRVPPEQRAAGVLPDPYHVWLSEVMLQQTTVAAVRDYFMIFITRWPSVDALAAAPRDDVLAAWAGLGYYARARNLHRCAQVVAKAGGQFPNTEEGLRALPGIGPYTAAAIAAIAFDRPAAVMDGNVERVMARLFAEDDPMPAVKERLRLHVARLTPRTRPGDYAQAVMDLGATVCTPRRPACGVCPVQTHCRAHAKGIAEDLPRRAPQKAKPVRFGTAYLALDQAGGVLTVRRPEQGLLGGMLALPSTVWSQDPPPPAPPFAADWQSVGEVRHTFTHFHLRLSVERTLTTLENDVTPLVEAEAAMPTVFAKALRLAQAERQA